VTSLTAIFGNSDEKPNEEESQKLLELYWNRAELKKAFAELRNEQFNLKDRVKHHEGVAARVQQKLDHLEQLLLDPDWVYNVIIYYQLKHLNLVCQGKLEKFAEQLKQQREKKQHRQLLARWNEDKVREARSVEKEIGEHRMQVQLLEDRLQAERHRLSTMGGIMKLFRRRSLTASLDRLAQSIDAAQHEEQALLLKYDEIQSREPPDTEGLTVPTKRLINFMILAFGQQLYLHFSKDGLAGMAKEASEKSVGAIDYGSKRDCDAIISRIKKRCDSFEKATELADVLQQRAKLIAEKAMFRGDDDAVPVSGTVSTVYSIGKGGVKTSDANLLGENYWDLTNILSR
jgi:hypothetical protein